MPYRIEVLAHSDDGRAKTLEQSLKAKGHDARVRVVDVYVSENERISSETFIGAVANPVTQQVNAPLKDFNWALEIGFLPGVTDNIAHTAQELLDLAGATNDNECFSARLYLIKGDLKKSDIEDLAASLANPLIQRIQIKDEETFQKDGGMGIVLPKVALSNHGAVADPVDLNLDDAALAQLGKEGIPDSDGTRRGPLGLSLLYLKAIQDYFRSEGRAPTDIEIETLAQTWSEHCKHTIFASPIDDIQEGIYRHYIKRATQEIRKNRKESDFCVSVFSDNAGGIVFDENWLITDKVETHNSPSALDPFGGAITGIVGVNRDCMGFGKGAKPVINRYGFCFADPRTEQTYFRDKDRKIPVLSAETIMNGVVHGVHVGGNCSGIPTPQGFAYFDPRFIGKPLVFVGTIGLIPRTINGTPGHEKRALPGDIIVMAGGRVGRDGIHGATFSSVALDEGSPATAVQIGDPITQKKMSDALVKEVRDFGWYNAITDNGAGGLSSSVGEMAGQSGGFHLELDKVPLKYPGMAPWEIWISESQERMTLAVPPENVEKLIEFLARRGVEATAIGTYTGTGRAVVSWRGETIMDLDMEFLHDGVPETPLKTTFTAGGEAEPSLPALSTDALLSMLSRLNICSKEFIATQYDHNVQGSAVLGPLQGPGRVYADATITKPVLNSPKGVVLSQGLFPRYSDIDTKHMAACGLDMAVRSAVAAGADFNHLALLDNFCWCSSDEPERLGQLKRAAEVIYDLAVLYGTPFISGKDSMFNDFKGFDAGGQPVKISAPPTLLVSSIGVIPDVEQSISLAPKAVGDLVYLLGETKDELGGGEYYDELGHLGRNVPQVDGAVNYQLYKIYSRAARERLMASAIAVGYGGLGVALAKTAIAGRMGLDIDLSAFDLEAQRLLFSESAGRILVTVAPQNVKDFEKTFKKFAHVYKIGHVAYGNGLNIKDLLTAEISMLEKAYKAPLRDY
ncbi:MAG: phosphoribosylformylglycinamidine synthase [Alphaproteobacteria bacterium]|nr:phosphoribosylformylglycinamidine synthase [Alphaproteobacteria bacterium]